MFWLESGSYLCSVSEKYCVSFQDFFGKETSGSEDSREAGEGGTGRWKVPTYKDYLYLFRSLLNCDTMKVKT